MVSVARVDGAFSPAVYDAGQVPWAVLVRHLTWPVAHEGDKLTAPAWLPVRFKDGAPMVRKDEHVAAVSCLVLDVDDGANVNQMRATLAGLGFRAVLHTTWSHKPDHHKARVILPLAEECPRAEWLEVWQAADRWAREVVGATIDPACKNPSRLYFLPALPAIEWERYGALLDFVGEEYSGEVLSWRWLAAHYPPPKPVNSLPPIPKPPQWAGVPMDDLERERRFRHLRSVKIIEGGCRKFAEGNRNPRCYTLGRTVAQLAQTGAATEAELAAIVIHHAVAAGLSLAEAEGAVRKGINKGKGDPPWSF